VVKLHTLVCSTGKLDQINPSLVQHLSDLTGLDIGQSTVGEIGRVHLEGDEEFGSVYSGFDGVDDTEEDTGFVLQRSSPFVVTLVDSGRQELGKKVSVSAVCQARGRVEISGSS
jgi:hypothetical protein